MCHAVITSFRFLGVLYINSKIRVIIPLSILDVIYEYFVTVKLKHALRKEKKDTGIRVNGK